MDEEILERMNDISVDDLESLQFYISKTEIDYDDIINVWKSYIEKRYFEKNSIINFSDVKTKSIIKISFFENIFGIILEEVFKNQINNIDDDLLLFYLKGKKKVLLLYKSYIPLLNSDKIMLPFWEYYLESKKLCDQINNLFKDEENICVMTYTLN